LDVTVMPVLKNPRHERFAQLLASGKTATDAYEEAGYKRNDGNGPALARTEEINGRVTEINGQRLERQQKVEAAATERAIITRAGLIEMCRDTYIAARQSGQFGAATQALKELGVLSGLRIERAEHGRAGEFQWIESLTPEDLRALADGTLDVIAYQQRDGNERTVN
jgi:hypothetical protein